MTALNLRVWWTAAAGLWRDWWTWACAAAVAVAGLAVLTLTVAYLTVTPMQDAALVALLPLAPAGSTATTLILPKRPRRAPSRAPGTRRPPRPVRGQGCPREGRTGAGAHSQIGRAHV